MFFFGPNQFKLYDIGKPYSKIYRKSRVWLCLPSFFKLIVLWSTVFDNITAQSMNDKHELTFVSVIKQRHRLGEAITKIHYKFGSFAKQGGGGLTRWVG